MIGSSLTREDTNLPSDRFSDNFSPLRHAQALLQLNDSADLWSTNFRVGWLQDANTGLFLVYNDRGDWRHDSFGGGAEPHPKVQLSI